jgi:hypothetical protein
MSKYEVLKRLDSVSAGRILWPGEIFEADLDEATEKTMVDTGLIKKLTVKQAAAKKKLAPAKAGAKTEEVETDGSN